MALVVTLYLDLLASGASAILTSANQLFPDCTNEPLVNSSVCNTDASVTGCNTQYLDQCPFNNVSVIVKNTGMVTSDFVNQWES
jgi:hypothetical protein